MADAPPSARVTSTDSLIDMLARLGVHVRFVVKPSHRRVA
jgi:hypothetical protein